MPKEVDVKNLVASAGVEGDTPPQPNNPQPVEPVQAQPEVGQDGEVEVVARQLAELMKSNPEVAARIADVLESVVLGKEEPMMSVPVPPTGQEPMGHGPMGPGPMGPGHVVTGTQTQPSVDPAVIARLEEIERQMANHEVDRELSRVVGKYGQLRSHFGDVLPESLEEKALLQKVHEVITGKASPFDVALAVLLLEQATSGDGTLRDRILASAAKGMQKPPAVEGRGGGVATSEGTPDVSKMSTTQLMDYIKGAVAARRGQPG